MMVVKVSMEVAEVALRKESVDRNIYTSAISALRSCRSPQGERGEKFVYNCRCTQIAESLSARRAWIEIVMPFFAILQPKVALRKESVDRNRLDTSTAFVCRVALRKESVDRNKL